MSTGDTYLCKAWGETDLPVAAIVTGLEGVSAFLVAEWLGSANAHHDDGTNSLQAALQDMQDEWSREGESWEWSAEFEIGGVSVQKVGHAAAPAPSGAVAAKPDMFWNDDDAERCGESIHEVIDREMSNGCLEIGNEMTIQQAQRLPNIRVRIVAAGEDDWDYEIIDAAPVAAQPQGDDARDAAARRVFEVMGHDHQVDWDDCTSVQKEFYLCVARAAGGVTLPQTAEAAGHRGDYARGWDGCRAAMSPATGAGKGA